MARFKSLSCELLRGVKHGLDKLFSSVVKKECFAMSTRQAVQKLLQMMMDPKSPY